MLSFFDTLVGAKVPFTPRDPGAVSLYVCGPTVYDAPHVGHGRSALVFDVLRRYLAWRGFAVTHVSNVTDVDDKIIARAAREGSTEPEVAATWEAAYRHELDRLDILRPDHIPHATGYIDEMVALVTELVDAGRAYVIDGLGVYLAVDEVADYGALPHRRPGDLADSAGARVDVEERKRGPLDFVLWKAAKPGEPSWPSPWGPGRPGWHIECSAMSLDILGEGFDLHGGGDDLVFPHHENERVQAEAAGHPFARHWLHHGMVVVGGEKMSKSLGNFDTLASALDAHDPRGFRLTVLQAHYRSPMELGRSDIARGEASLARLDNLVRRAGKEQLPAASPDPDVVARFTAAMDDDLNSPAAMAVVFDAVSRANQALDVDDLDEAAALVAAVVELTGALGLQLGDRRAGPSTDDAEIDALVEQRAAARAARDFATADRLRDELAARGVTIEDGAGGTTWHR
jgi:cysteinyl-tRNA synthetase